MRRPRAIVLALSLALATCATPSGSDEPDPRRSIARQHAPPQPDIDVEHYSLELELEPRSRTIRGTCRVRVWPRVASLLCAELDLVGLHVSRVADSRGRELAFEHRAGRLAITLAEPLARDDFEELAIHYAGRPARGLYFARERDGLPTQVFTQGECEDARRWFPCNDLPGDRATSEIRVTLPRGWISVAAGERIDQRELDDGRTVEHWRMNAPHPAYLVTLVAGEFTRHERVWDRVPLEVLAAPEFDELVEATFAGTDEALTFLSDVTALRYPYPKYSQACVDDFPFGGMENISATTLTDACLRDERGLRDGDAQGLIVHEAAHQWFGNLMTCADWSHVWLNEGFATYMDLLYTEAVEGADEHALELDSMLEAYLAGDKGPSRRAIVCSAWKDPMDLFPGGITYQGGALRLHHLRFCLGDAAFFRGLRRYVADNQGRSVVTEDFRRAMEQASGADLGGWFEQWLYGPGYPEVRATWSWNATTGRAQVELAQTQSSFERTPAVFSFPLEIELGLSGGPRLERVEFQAREARFEFACSERPSWVVVDPSQRVPMRAQSVRDESEWRLLAAGHVNPVRRREALQALARELERDPREGASNCAALLAALSGDPVGEVRAAAAVGLGPVAAAPSVRSALERAAAGDAHAAARAAALEALAKVGVDAALAVFAQEQYTAGFSWRAMLAAAKLRAQAKPEDAATFLESELSQSLHWKGLPKLGPAREFGVHSPHGVLEAGLIAVLAEVAPARALEHAQSLAFDARFPSDLRVAAANVIGRRENAGVHSRELLERLLFEDDFRLRGASIALLQASGDRAAMPALERAWSRPIDVRHKRAIERAIAALEQVP